MSNVHTVHERFQSEGKPVTDPDVSVIVSTYNSLELLKECLASIARQTLPWQKLEVIVIDDGSTDGTWDYLQQLGLSMTNLRALRQKNSGGPSVGRNRGIDLARGRYLFFADADDWLGDEALARLVARADEFESDVILGKLKGVGRPAPTSIFAETVVDADLITNQAWRLLGPTKLFRTSMVMDAGARFPEDMVQGEDQIFVATCYFAAKRVSILGDYDYYYVRGRVDGDNLSKKPQSLQNKILTTTRLADLILANVAPSHQDQYFNRVMIGTLSGALHRAFMLADESERADFLAALKQRVLPYLSDAILDKAPDHRRLRLAMAKYGSVEQLLQLNRLLAGVPHLTVHDGRVSYDLTPELNAQLGDAVRAVKDGYPLHHRLVGIAFVAGEYRIRCEVPPLRVSPEVDGVSLELRQRTSEVSHVVSGSCVGPGIYEFNVDLSALLAVGRGDNAVWDLQLLALIGGVCLSTTRVSCEAFVERFSAHFEYATPAESGAPIYGSMYRTMYGNLSIRVHNTPSNGSAKLVSREGATLLFESPKKLGGLVHVRLYDATKRLLGVSGVKPSMNGRSLAVDLSAFVVDRASLTNAFVVELSSPEFMSQSVVADVAGKTPSLDRLLSRIRSRLQWKSLPCLLGSSGQSGLLPMTPRSVASAATRG